jgi:hypothetical protein
MSDSEQHLYGYANLRSLFSEALVVYRKVKFGSVEWRYQLVAASFKVTFWK